MNEYLVTFTSMVIEAENEDEAIKRACEFKGGGHWEAQLQTRDNASTTRTYNVAIVDLERAEFVYWFTCEAENEAHAIEQAQDACVDNEVPGLYE